jgi:hypothetical protein
MVNLSLKIIKDKLYIFLVCQQENLIINSVRQNSNHGGKQMRSTTSIYHKNLEPKDVEI